MRVLLALGTGLAAAAFAGTATFLSLTGDLGIVGAPRLLLSLPVIGAVATAPGWLVALLFLLPVVTHLAERRSVAHGTYYGVAIAAGGMSTLASPLGILAVSEGEAYTILPVLIACGGVAGLCFAAVWHLFVLNEVAARRADRTGTDHG
jgi:hypothetical protein